MQIRAISTVKVSDRKVLQTDQFLKEFLADPIAGNKIVKINCGRKGPKAKAVADELCSDAMWKRLLRYDGFATESRTYHNFVWESWLQLPKRHIFVEIKRTATPYKIHDIYESGEPYSDFNPTDHLKTFEPTTSNNSENGSVLEPEAYIEEKDIVSFEIDDHLSVTDMDYFFELINSGRTVKLTDEDFACGEAIEIEKGETWKDVKINLNTYNLTEIGDSFIPLVPYFTAQTMKVHINSVDPSIQDEETLFTAVKDLKTSEMVLQLNDYERIRSIPAFLSIINHFIKNKYSLVVKFNHEPPVTLLEFEMHLTSLLNTNKKFNVKEERRKGQEHPCFVLK